MIKFGSTLAHTNLHLFNLSFFTNITVEDRMFLEMQNFDFFPNLIKFYPNFTQFILILPKFYAIYPNLPKFHSNLPKLV